MYASKTPRDLNHDRFPFVWSKHSERDQMRSDTDMFRRGVPISFPDYHLRPRPEFDHVQHNEPNPILAIARTAPLDLRHDGIAWFDWANGQAWSEEEDYDKWCAHEDHAFRILTRLADLEGVRA